MSTLTSPSLPPLSVSQLTNAIKLSLESTFSFIYLQGEISNFKIQSSGHLYFSLKDENAQIAVVMFRTDAATLRIMPKAGDQVVVKGELQVYPPKGNYQLVIRELSYVGMGELLQKLEMLKIKLHQMGWFKANRKKPLPRFPRVIGVVTSPTGAVIQDIVNVLTRRFNGFHLILNPVKVQGEGAAQEIAQSIDQFNQFNLADVLIVGRGGGSLEDLWAFNEEIVASAIYRSSIPIVSAVGHETDHCIADYVADVRAPTPSAAAEIVTSEKKALLEHLETIRKRMKQCIVHKIQQNIHRLNGLLKHPIIKQPHTLLEWRMQKLDDYKTEIEQSIRRLIEWKRLTLENKTQQSASLKPINQIHRLKEKLTTIQEGIQQTWKTTLVRYRQKLLFFEQELTHIWHSRQSKRRELFRPKQIRTIVDQFLSNRLRTDRQRLIHLRNILEALDPKKLLKKGYSILFAQKGSFVIHSVKQIEEQQQARLLLSDGEALITFDQVIASESTKH